MLNKRTVKLLQSIVNNPPLPDRISLPPNHMNIRELRYPIPSSMLYSLGDRTVKMFKLRTGYTVSILQVLPNTSTHKHSMSSDNSQRAWFLCYVGANPTQLTYWDPRTNCEKTTQLTPGKSFVLSTHHRFFIDNTDSNTSADFIQVNAMADWPTTVRLFQHQW